MTDQVFIIRTKELRSAAAKAVLAIQASPICEVVIRPHVKTRTDGQNARYWADLTEQLRQLCQEIDSMSDHTGYTPLEVRRMAAKGLSPEHTAILYTHSPEAAHEVLKVINGIPTSTRLGTKAFMKFEGIMIMNVAEVVGAVRSLARRAV